MLYPKSIRRLLLLVMCLFSCASHSAIIVTAYETATDVIFEAQGSLDITGLTPFTASQTNSFISPSENRFFIGPTEILPFEFYLATASSSQFGNKLVTVANSGSGARVGVSASGINLPQGYQSGTDISSTAIFNMATFDSLGLIEGSYSWTLSTNDNLTLNVTTAPIPLPATIWLLISAMGVVLHRRA